MHLGREGRRRDKRGVRMFGEDRRGRVPAANALRVENVRAQDGLGEDLHRCRDWKSVLGSQQNCYAGTKLHGEAPGRGMKGEAVADNSLGGGEGERGAESQY
jgi:hypothetical protein